MTIADRVYDWLVGSTPHMPPTNFKLDKALIDMWKQRLLYTPDANLLDRYTSHLLFVYDRLMEGRHEFHILAEYSDPVATAFTEKRFCNWRKNLGSLSFPIALETNREPDTPGWASLEVNKGWFKNAPPAIVKGQLYSLFTDKLYELDKHYRNTKQFIRKRTLINIPFRVDSNAENEYICRLWAWMYVGNSDHWEDQLDAGMNFSPVRIFKPKNQVISEYSFFEQPTGDPPKEEEPFVPKVRKVKTAEDGHSFEIIWVPAPLQENPYKNQLDGASPVQRIINSEQSG